MRSRILLALAIIILAFLVTPSFADQNRYVRLRYADGDVQINAADGQREATINTPLLDGDELATGDGKAELAFHNGVVVRVGDSSAVRINSAYAPMRIELLQGTLFVDTHMVSSIHDELEVQAGEAQVYLIQEGNMRVDLGDEGSVRVTAVQGEAEVRSAGGRVLVEEGERTYVDPGKRPEQPEQFTAQYDDLDDWNQSRMDFYASGQTYGDNYGGISADNQLYPDTYDLNAYGTWQDYENYGNVWVPNVDSDWQPYYDGRWDYINNGWFWVSYEPWGWAPYHYGRWGWGLNIGWYWMPGYSFGPSWVSWYDDGDYIGWCPLGYHDVPVYVNLGHSYYYIPQIQKQKLSFGDSMVFVQKDQIGAHDIKKIAAPHNAIQKIKIDQSRFVKAPEKDLARFVVPKTGGGIVVGRPGEKTGITKNPYGTSYRPGLTKGPYQVGSEQGRSRDRETQFNPGRSSDGNSRSGRPATSKPAENGTSSDGKTHSSPSRTYDRPSKPDTSRTPDKSHTSSSTNKKPAQNFDREEQFRRNFDRSSQPINNRGERDLRFRSFENPYQSPYRDRDRQFRTHTTDRSRQVLPWFRDPRSYEQNRPNDNDRLSPRYIDEARKLFERFGPRNQSDRVDDHPNAPPSNEWRPREGTRRDNPPRIESRPPEHERSQPRIEQRPPQRQAPPSHPPAQHRSSPPPPPPRKKG